VVKQAIAVYSLEWLGDFDWEVFGAGRERITIISSQNTDCVVYDLDFDPFLLCVLSLNM